MGALIYINIKIANIRDTNPTYLTIIPQTRVGYELLDSGRGASDLSFRPF